MSLFLVIAAGLFGALIGSFLNVVIWRVPRKESLSTPASHCPNCNHPIRWHDNIPIVSWLVLRARCRDCGTSISARYPVVEATTAVIFAGVVLWAVFSGHLGAIGDTLQTASFVIAVIAFLYFAAISIALALIDLDIHRLPNAIVLPAYAVGGVLLAVASILDGDPWVILRAVIGAASLFAAYFLMVIIYPRGMGFGDVKLAGVLGLFLSWLGTSELVVGAFAAFVLGGLFSIALLIGRRAGRKSQIPFGPWMLAGAWVGIFVGRQLAQWYLGLFGLV